MSQDKIRLMHMLDAAREAMSFAAGKDRDDLNKEHLHRGFVPVPPTYQ